jgi:hypothetical protein
MCPSVLFNPQLFGFTRAFHPLETNSHKDPKSFIEKKLISYLVLAKLQTVAALPSWPSAAA